MICNVAFNLEDLKQCHGRKLAFEPSGPPDSVILKIPGPPNVPTNLHIIGQVGGLNILPRQVVYQAQIPVFVILKLGTDIDLVVRRIRVDVVDLSIPPGLRYPIRWERLKMLLLLRRCRANGRETGG